MGSLELLSSQQALRRKPSSEQHNHAPRPPHPWCRCLSTEGRLRVWRRSTQAPSSPFQCRQAQASLVCPFRTCHQGELQRWGEAVLSGAKEVFESPTSEIFVPEGKGTDICIFFAPPQPQVWQLGKGVSYNSKSCSEGCCFYTPASSSRVQEIEAEVEKNLPTWFRTPAGGCDAVPKTTFNSRLVLNKDNNDSGNEAAL